MDESVVFLLSTNKTLVDKISVIGSGSWATALVKILTENKCKVNWYVRRSHVAKQINESGRNPNYISYLTLDIDYLEASSNLEEVVSSSDYVLFALPSAFVADLVGRLDPEIFKTKKILVSIKGMVSKTNQTPLAFIVDQLKLMFTSGRANKNAVCCCVFHLVVSASSCFVFSSIHLFTYLFFSFCNH